MNYIEKLGLVGLIVLIVGFFTSDLNFSEFTIDMILFLIFLFLFIFGEFILMKMKEQEGFK